MSRLAEAAIQGGADVLQLRDKDASNEDLLAQAKKLLIVTRHYGIPLIINDRLEIVQKAGAEGLHLGQEDGSLREARQQLGEDAILGRSTHSPEQALAAEKEGFDYVGIGPVFTTPTKPGRPAVGHELVRFASKNLNIPFVAIGGIDESNILSVAEAGAKCVAVVRALMGSADPRLSAQNFLTQLKETERKVCGK